MVTRMPTFRQAARDGKPTAQKKRYPLLPWITDPTLNVKEGPTHFSFSQRHEANSMELFFDLFFVANLALFTQYHIIVDNDGFVNYVAFFGILWGTWFSITMFDVRFADDCMYERACKLVQCAVFVVFSLVGSHFQPTGSRTYGISQTPSNETLQILSYALAASRALFAIQYLNVAYFCYIRGLKQVILPVVLNVLCYSISATALGLLSLAFRTPDYLRYVYVVWYATMVIEIICVLGVSAKWRDISFKHTHLVERMGLLTLIVIGEGILGIGKTISIILRTTQVSEYYGLTLVILLIIFMMYAIYFDSTPDGLIGTLRQQFWAFLHFPLHLSIIGVVEGVQQLVRGRYFHNTILDFADDIQDLCAYQHLEGSQLVDPLQLVVDNLKLEDKANSLQLIPLINDSLQRVANTTGICNPENTRDILASPVGSSNWVSALTEPIYNLFSSVAGGIYASTLVDNQVPTAEQIHGLERDLYTPAYSYFWGALALFAATTVVLNLLSRRTAFDISMWIAIAARVHVTIVAIVLGVVGGVDIVFYSKFGFSVGVAPIAFACLFWIFGADHVGRLFSNLALDKSGGPDDASDEEKKANGDSEDQLLPGTTYFPAPRHIDDE
ncbi:hypothetical protein EJ05DRAFT_496983 [Pseudovirgaria hyperparasitica]|uniref:Low temperature requirement A n=1 Tax=Pseudovirgaria hyperparasitica TaxID=470096 RepID=A0A6A6WH31_9PEZI|nr:uncharacterized protein EJ05DRAFT_496983 [Pseudovirgaria hyperparasitica]KAF2762113.1 hypothetical protein EJ05DRAFT_496983 [Pseudovirgaria hyperparasitica]